MNFGWEIQLRYNHIIAPRYQSKIAENFSREAVFLKVFNFFYGVFFLHSSRPPKTFDKASTIFGNVFSFGNKLITLCFSVKYIFKEIGNSRVF